MNSEEVLARLESEASSEVRDGMLRYGIPNENARGVPMSALKRLAKELGRSHELAGELWATGVYEARILATMIDEPDRVTKRQMDAWAADFDSWAIVDMACFSLFDKTSFAWKKTAEWAGAPEEFVRRAAFALIWALSIHDKTASDEQFISGLETIEQAAPDSRPLVKKAIDMALRATGKRTIALNRAAIAVAERMASDQDKDRAWIGKHALRELTSEKVQTRLHKHR